MLMIKDLYHQKITIHGTNLAVNKKKLSYVIVNIEKYKIFSTEIKCQH